jgi:histidinol-phosphatase
MRRTGYADTLASPLPMPARIPRATSDPPSSASFTAMARYADDLALAHVLADTADAIAVGRFRSMDLRVNTKPDLTPVSDADTAVEKALRGTLARARPRDGVLGEEFGVTEAAAGPGTRQWVIDPIDGTKNYVRGVPIWATLIALLDSGRPVVGLVSAPALGRRWWAGVGHGAYAGKHASAATAIHVSGVTRLADASFCYSDLCGWEQGGRLDAILDIMRRSWRSRAYGDFYGYMLVAEGAVDIMVEPELSLWDLAALVPIVTEAGGEFTDLAGRPGPGGGNAVATNGKLHTDVLERLGSPTGGWPPAGR